MAFSLSGSQNFYESITFEVSGGKKNENNEKGYSDFRGYTVITTTSPVNR